MQRLLRQAFKPFGARTEPLQLAASRAQLSRADAIEPISTVGQYTDDELQAFDVYDDVTESIFESLRLYHPYECRNFFVRKVRADGMTYVDKVRRCD